MAKINFNEIADPLFWKNFWEQMKKKSILAETQQNSPENWLSFYEKTSDIWLEMRGSPWELGERVFSVLRDNDAVKKGSSVLDLGCGSGLLAIPFARSGLSVTALDNSRAMIAKLRQIAGKENLSNIQSEVISWDLFHPAVKYDLVSAAFFPEAFSPWGIEKLEGLSEGYCALIFSPGEDTFPLRKALWKDINRCPLPDRGYMLPFVFNYLSSLGRKPNCRRLLWEEVLDIPIKTAVRFYSAYFEIFGHKAPGINERIESILLTYAQNERIYLHGKTDTALIWWQSVS